MPDQERERPRPHLLRDLAGVVVADRVEVGRSMVAQPVQGQRRVILEQEPDLPGEIETLHAENVANDVIAVATTAARTGAHLCGDARRDAVEGGPGRLQE